MNPDPTLRTRRKETLVLVLLGLIFVCGVAFLLLLATGWIAVVVAAVAVGIAVLGLINYLAWGRRAAPVPLAKRRPESGSGLPD